MLLKSLLLICNVLGFNVSDRVAGVGERVFIMECLMDGAIGLELTCRNAKINNSDQTEVRSEPLNIP